MKSAEARDAMVARVQKAHKEWPSFESLPEKAAGPSDVTAPIRYPDPKAYVEALYEVCAIGEPYGREGIKVVGKRL